MRSTAVLFVVASVALPACSVGFEGSVSWGTDSTSDPEPAPAQTTVSAPAPPPATPTVAPAAAPSAEGYAEVVDVYPRDKLGGRWLCTGTLIAKDVVVTAAHCLGDEMVSWDVSAPLAPGKPKVKAARAASYGGSFEEVANPDIGILRLATPITLARYANVVDVTARVEAGEAIRGAAVVRTSYDATSTFVATDGMNVSSAVQLGYEHGFAVPMFSKGGDSGAGLFLVVDGKPTHDLIGIARQPEPARQVDHFTRVDDGFVAWLSSSK